VIVARLKNITYTFTSGPNYLAIIIFLKHLLENSQFINIIFNFFFVYSRKRFKYESGWEDLLLLTSTNYTIVLNFFCKPIRSLHHKNYTSIMFFMTEIHFIQNNKFTFTTITSNCDI